MIGRPARAYGIVAEMAEMAEIAEIAEMAVISTCNFNTCT